ncbi:MAG TPA: hypothetical protein VMS38_24705 [Pseudorhodoferax sp.]|nr:hypothetical protein [Pseudorhodoferax sp.]
MPLDYFRTIAQSELPLRVEDEHGVQCVHVLRAAGLVEATVVYGDATGAPFAIVHAITHEGQAALQRDSRNKPLA